MELHLWLLFASIALIATITPGPAVLLATSHSAVHGWLSALYPILGNITGLFIMSALSLLGLSAVILSSSLLFEIVKVIGAVYLIYLGVKIWRRGFSRVTQDGVVAREPLSNARAYVQGLVVALSNPKAIAFTTALFPQFIDHEANLPLQFALLVGTFMLLSFLCLTGYAYVTAHASRRLGVGLHDHFSKLFGAAFIGSAIVLIRSSRESF